MRTKSLHPLDEKDVILVTIGRSLLAAQLADERAHAELRAGETTPLPLVSDVIATGPPALRR
jgi:hypothetical protein